MTEKDKKLIADIVELNINQVDYLPNESYPCGIRNCCYHHTYQTPKGKYSVEAHCGCEVQTIPDGSKIKYIISKEND